MFMIDQKINKRLECHYKHTALDIKLNYHPGPTRTQLEEQARQQAATQGEGVAAPSASTHAPSAPHASSRSHSRRGGSRELNWEKPPSPIRKMFNMIFRMCKPTNDVVHKERQRRKKDSLRLKKMQEVALPNDRPSPIGSEGQQSDPENLEKLNARYQQEDYWGQLYGSGSFTSVSYANPTYVDPSTAPMPQQLPQRSRSRNWWIWW
jgi:hypothetical protein